MKEAEATSGIFFVGESFLDQWHVSRSEKMNQESGCLTTTGNAVVELPGGCLNAALALAGIQNVETTTWTPCDKKLERAYTMFLHRLGSVSGPRPLGNRLTGAFIGHGVPVKSRFVDSRGRVVHRHDQEFPNHFANAEFKLNDTFRSGFGFFDKQPSALVMVDYGKGFFNGSNPAGEWTDAIRLVRETTERGVPVVVETKNRKVRFGLSSRVAEKELVFLKMNLAEGREYAGLPSADPVTVANAVQHIAQCNAVVTDGQRGAAWSNFGFAQFVSLHPWRNVGEFSESGAGDAFTAFFAHRLSVLMREEVFSGSMVASMLSDIVNYANLGARACGYAGTPRGWAVSSELTNDQTAAKIHDSRDLEFLCKFRWAGQKIAFVNGCFDLLHEGHLHLLEEARRGDCTKTVVLVNGDESVLRRKNRLAMPAAHRSRLIASLSCVDAVHVFAGDSCFDELFRIVDKERAVCYKGSELASVDFTERSLFSRFEFVKEKADRTSSVVARVKGS